MRFIYDGHEVDIYIGSPLGYVAYLDNDLELHDISEEEYLEIATNGQFISYFKK